MQASNSMGGMVLVFKLKFNRIRRMRVHVYVCLIIIISSANNCLLTVAVNKKLTFRFVRTIVLMFVRDRFSTVCMQRATRIIVGVNVLAPAPQRANVIQYPVC